MTITPRRRARTDWVAYLYVLPALAFFAIFVLRPLGEAMWFSLFDWDGIGESEWVGAANYLDAISDPKIGEALSHSFVFIALYAFVPLGLALLVVAVLSRFRVRGLAFFRAALFVPYILSSVVVAIAWRWIFAQDGPLNGALRAIGLGDLTRAWLGDFDTALPSVGFVGTWVMVGLAFVLLVTGLQGIPTELFEAARLDGAGPVREFLAVTLPGIRGEVRVSLVLMITAALRNFDIVWNTTRGGPGTSTTVPSTFIYLEAFQQRDIGAASAIAVMLTVLILVVIGIVLWVLRDTSAKAVRA